MDKLLLYGIIGSSILAIVSGLLLAKWIMDLNTGNAKMQ